jgi:hypothetical protein
LVEGVGVMFAKLFATLREVWWAFWALFRLKRWTDQKPAVPPDQPGNPGAGNGSG